MFCRIYQGLLQLSPLLLYIAISIPAFKGGSDGVHKVYMPFHLFQQVYIIGLSDLCPGFFFSFNRRDITTKRWSLSKSAPLNTRVSSTDGLSLCLTSLSSLSSLLGPLTLVDTTNAGGYALGGRLFVMHIPCAEAKDTSFSPFLLVFFPSVWPNNTFHTFFNCCVKVPHDYCDSIRLSHYTI